MIEPPEVDTLAALPTEARNPNSTHIDQLSTLEMLAVINREDQSVALAVERELPQIARAVDAIAGASVAADGSSISAQGRAGGWACSTPRSARPHFRWMRRWCRG